MTSVPTTARWGQAHLDQLQVALGSLSDALPRIRSWGECLASRLSDGGRLLVAGNGGSAAQAQHLTAELVGRYRDERQPLSALALHAETSTVTAVVNDYGPDAVFARQVVAHGRLGDVLLLLSTSGRSANVCAAAAAGRDAGLLVWVLTGRSPNPLVDLADEAVAIGCADNAAVQEAHLVAIHLVCEALDARLARLGVLGADCDEISTGQNVLR